MEAERLSLPGPWRRRLEAWSAAAAPREACGLLLGRREGPRAAVERALWSPNLARSADRFELDPSAHLLGHQVAGDLGLEVVGVWHSHPRSDPRPSSRDRAGALPGWWYVIVGCAPRPALGAWWSAPSGLRPGLLESAAGSVPARPRGVERARVDSRPGSPETTMPITVRPAGSADLDFLVRSNAAMALETEGLELEPDRLRAGVRAVLEDAEGGGRGAYRVALDPERPDRGPLGGLLVTREWSDWRNGWFWWIQSVYVEPEARRRGVLAALYRDVLAEARARDDVRGVRLYVERENRGAREAYRRLGMADSSYRLMEVELAGEPHGAE